MIQSRYRHHYIIIQLAGLIIYLSNVNSIGFVEILQSLLTGIAPRILKIPSGYELFTRSDKMHLISNSTPGIMNAKRYSVDS